MNKAWIEQIHKRHWYQLRYRCWEVTKDRAASEDCVQEAYVAALRVPTDFTSIGHVRNYLFMVALHNACGYMERQSMVKRTQWLVEYHRYRPEKSSTLFDYHPLGAQVLQSIEKLDPVGQLAIAAYMYSLPLSQVSEAFGLHPQKLKSKLRTATGQLKAMMAPQINMRSQVLALRSQGISFAGIGQKLGISKNSAWQYHSSQLNN